MFSRRYFLGGVSAASLATFSRNTFALRPFLSEAPDSTGKGDNLRHVKIAIGTGGHGHTYPGATVPFGAVQLSPDTGVRDWDHCSGYHYSDNAILGFSHTHLSGTGCIDMLDFLLMPGSDDFHFDPHAEIDGPTSYRAHFSHRDEVAVPGYYSVLLQESKIKAELTATERVGVHKYTFPASRKSIFLLDLMHGGVRKPGPSDPDPSKIPPTVRWSFMKVVSNDTIVGGRATDVWGMGREIYFCMKFSKPFAHLDAYSAGELVPGNGEVRGTAVRAVLQFATDANEVVHVKTGISGVSVEGAEANLKAEAPGWDFEAVRASAHASWVKALGRIHVTAGDPKYLEILYTGLYHMMVAPTLFDDVDGHYRGMDGKVHQLPAGEHNYSTFSLWDTYRAAHPLYTLILGEKVPAFVNCLIRMANESLAGVPVWPLQGTETGCMVGYHSAPVVAEAIAKGFPGIDPKAAYAPYRKRALVDDYRGLDAYRKLGYVPCDLQDESASKTLDYCYDDHAVASLARAAGEQADSVVLKKQSSNFTNLFDKETGFIRPRYSDGHWAGPFDPTEISITRKWRDYTEANAWQTTFCVQHDPKLLIATLGGNEAFVAKLDGLFNASSVMPADMPPDVTGLVGQYSHGNEPCHHVAYLYNFAGAAHKTQKRVRSLMEEQYNNQPDGMAGNEDCGQMSAWFVISALGLYAVDPVSARYDFGTPLFDHIEVTTGPGRKLVIQAERESPSAIYIKSVTWNGAPVDGLSIAHASLAQGGSLVFHLADKPA